MDKKIRLQSKLYQSSNYRVTSCDRRTRRFTWLPSGCSNMILRFHGFTLKEISGTNFGVSTAQVPLCVVGWLDDHPDLKKLHPGISTWIPRMMVWKQYHNHHSLEVRPPICIMYIYILYICVLFLHLIAVQCYKNWAEQINQNFS